LRLGRERRDEIRDGGSEHGRHDHWEEKRISADVASIRRCRSARCVRLRPRGSPGSHHEVGTSVCLKKEQHGSRAFVYPRRGEFCPENGGEGAPANGGPKGEIHIDRTHHSGGDEVLESEKLTLRRS